MKSRRALVLYIGAGALVVLAILTVLPGKEDEGPFYEGKRLGTWMDECSLESSGAEPEAALAALTNAVQSLGTNSLPYLVNWIQYKPHSSWYDKLQDRVQKLSRGHVHLPARRAEDRSVAAGLGVQILGPTAEPAIPEFGRLLMQEDTSYNAADCLLAIGPAAMPVLSNAVAVGTGRTRTVAITALAKFGQAARPIAPMLVQIIRSGNEYDRDEALRSLVEVDTNTDILVPLLAACFSGTNAPSTVAAAAYALGRIGAPGIPVLLQSLTNDQRNVRSFAKGALDFQKYASTQDKISSDRFLVAVGMFNLSALTAGSRFYSEDESNVTAQTLQEYLNDTNGAIRTAASNSLYYISNRSSDPASLP